MPSFIEPRRISEKAFAATIQEAYVAGVSTRSVIVSHRVVEYFHPSGADGTRRDSVHGHPEQSQVEGRRPENSPGHSFARLELGIPDRIVQTTFESPPKAPPEFADRFHLERIDRLAAYPVRCVRSPILQTWKGRRVPKSRLPGTMDLRHSPAKNGVA